MPPARRRPPTGSIRRQKVAGRTASSPSVDDEGTTDSVDLTKKAPPVPASPATGQAEAEAPETAPAEVDTTPTAWWTPRTMLLAALAVVFAVVALLAVVRPGTSEVSNAAWVDTSATLEVSSAARDALQTVFSYKFDTIDDDQAAARAVLNDERRAEYDSTAEQTKQGVIQTQTTTSAVVSDIGVTLLDGDRAELLASMDIAATQDTVDQGTVQTPVSLTMERVDGTWLLATIDNR